MTFPQPNAKRTLTSNLWHPEVTAIFSSSVSERRTTDAVLNNAHDTTLGYVGFSPSLKTVIVAHQGTDPSKV